MSHKQHISQNKKLIALVANTSWSIYNFRLHLIRDLKACGFEILVIAPKDNFSANLIAEGVQYQHIHIDNYGTSPLQEANTIRHFYKIYKRYRVDIIFHYTIKPNIYGSIAARLAGIPSIAITTGLGHLLSFNNNITRWTSLQLYRLASTLSKEVWFLNEIDREDFLKLGIVRKEKTFLLPGEGVDTEYFKPTMPKENGSSMRMLFAGRIIWDKGFKEFVEAAKFVKEKYPYVEFQVVGFVDPINPNAVPYQYIHDLQKSGLFKFFGETSDIRPFIQKAHCLVFPSFYREGLSRILLEAASMETPIITTNNVGCADLVDDHITGFVVPTKNTQALAEAMVTFINMPYSERIEMGNLARLKIINSHKQGDINKLYLSKLKEWGFDTNMQDDHIPIGHHIPTSK